MALIEVSRLSNAQRGSGQTFAIAPVCTEPHMGTAHLSFHPESDREVARMPWRKVSVPENAGELRASGQGKLSEKLVKRLWTSMVPLVLLLAACEDEGNAGDDNLLTGGSLIIVIIIVVIVAVLLLRRRR